jgi:hypothetical protein
LLLIPAHHVCDICSIGPSKFFSVGFDAAAGYPTAILCSETRITKTEDKDSCRPIYHPTDTTTAAESSPKSDSIKPQGPTPRLIRNFYHEETTLLPTFHCLCSSPSF